MGSASNVDEENGWEKDQRRAGILEINPDGSGMRIFATGLRNPVGMDWEPQTNVLWTVVNERDLLGDDLVPDYLTSVKEGGFYGWPFSYFGQNEDPRKKGQRPDLVAKAIKPDYAVGSHVAALGLAFYRGKAFPERYQGGAFIGMHGSWNRSKMVGYKVAFVPFENGKPAGPMEDILTGFIADESKFEAYGRPVGVTELPDGSLLVADDSGGKMWRVALRASKTSKPKCSNGKCDKSPDPTRTHHMAYSVRRGTRNSTARECMDTRLSALFVIPVATGIQNCFDGRDNKDGYDHKKFISEFYRPPPPIGLTLKAWSGCCRPRLASPMKVSACCQILITTSKVRPTKSLHAPPTSSAETRSRDSSSPAAL